MNPDRTRWGDSRLDDLANELRALRDIPMKLSELKSELKTLRRDMDACSQSVREHRDDFSTYVEEQEKTNEAHRLERKSDRRWMVGTVLTAAALVIAAMGLLVGHL